MLGLVLDADEGFGIRARHDEGMANALNEISGVARADDRTQTSQEYVYQEQDEASGAGVEVRPDASGRHRAPVFKRPIASHIPIHLGPCQPHNAKLDELVVQASAAV